MTAPATTSLDQLKLAFPEYAKDLKLNLGSVLGNSAGSALTEQQRWGTALAVAITSRGEFVRQAIAAHARQVLDEATYTAARAAAAIMSMNNVYYQTMHYLSAADDSYHGMPARLRMQVIGNPGVEIADFELWCLAVSAVNGCSHCVTSHERVLRNKGISRDAIHETVRIAAVVHGAAVTLETDTSSS